MPFLEPEKGMSPATTKEKVTAAIKKATEPTTTLKTRNENAMVPATVPSIAKVTGMTKIITTSISMATASPTTGSTTSTPMS